jgi:lipopolysaccharide export LptBFGC system permease protein LptF
MGLLDRSIARQYLTNIAVLLVVLFSFVVAIDMSLNFHRFFNVASTSLAATSKSPPGAVHATLLALIYVVDLWWPRLLQLFNYLIGLVLVGAMGFTCTQLVRSREFVAMLAGGISLVRVARPILLVAATFTLLQALNHEFIIPRLAPLLTREHETAGSRALGATTLRLGSDGQGRLWYARQFDADRNLLQDLTVIERDETGLGVRSIEAQSARWRAARPGESGAWELTGGAASSLREQTGKSEVVRAVSTDLDPTAMTIRRFAGYRQNLSWAQIGAMISRRELLADEAGVQARVDELERIRFGRPAVMLCNLLALVVCLPFFLRREPTNMLIPSLQCAPLAILALIGGVLGASVAVPGLPPQISVFLPALALIPLAIASVSAVKT